MLSEEVMSLKGKTGEPVILAVERGAIKKFADAVGDHNLLYWDDEYARNSRYGSLIAPPGFFGWPVKWAGSMPLAPKIRDVLTTALAKEGYHRLLDGGIEFDFYQPVRAGDTLVAVAKIADIYERESKGGKMVFSVFETSYHNQHGALVGLARQTLILR
jgi:acyl dehydratase